MSEKFGYFANFINGIIWKVIVVQNVIINSKEHQSTIKIPNLKNSTKKSGQTSRNLLQFWRFPNSDDVKSLSRLYFSYECY